MKKSFKLTQRPGQPLPPPTRLPFASPAGAPAAAPTVAPPEHPTRGSRTQTRRVSTPFRSSQPVGGMPRARLQGSPTTRKTIEVPEDYFFRVKMHALHRRIKEKDLWAEILEEYFTSHPDPE